MIRISDYPEDLAETISDYQLGYALMAAAGRTRRTKLIDEVVAELRAGYDGPARFKFWDRTGVVASTGNDQR